MSEAIIIALIGSGFLSAAISGAVTLVSKLIDNKRDKQTEISKQIKELSNDVKVLQNSVSNVKSDLDDYKAEDAENRIVDTRYRILRFADEIRHGEHHSEEHFLQIKDDVDKYEKYCMVHPLFKNERAKDAIALVRKTYDLCVENKNFLN